MAGVADPRRAPMMLAHHVKELTDEFLLKVMRGISPPSTTDHELRESLRKNRTELNMLGSIGAFYPHPWNTQAMPVQVSFTVRQAAKLQRSDLRWTEVATFERSPESWLRIRGPQKAFDSAVAQNAEWFLDRARAALPFFEPDYAAAHIDTKMANSIDKGLDNFVWPVMVYGPSRIPQIGEKVLMDAPAWKVERLPYGGIWIQSDENPFTPDAQKLKALGKHLGLKSPGK